MANIRGSITMADDEVEEFIRTRRTAILSTIGATGQPHSAAMWFALVEGQMVFETKVKSQKVVNLRRDPRLTVLLESGDTYPELQGLSIEGTARFVEDDKDFFREVARSVHDRYMGPAADASDQTLDELMHKRVAIVVMGHRTRSWDHRKLGLDMTEPPRGTTAGEVRGWRPSPSTDPRV